MYMKHGSSWSVFLSAASYCIWQVDYLIAHFLAQEPNRSVGERGGSVVECRTPEREVGGSKPTAAVLCPWARHFTPRKYWLITQEAVAPSRHDWKIVDWDVKPQHNQPIDQCPLKIYCVFFILNFMIANTVISKKSYFRLYIWWGVIYVQREQQGTKNSALGDTWQNGSQSDFTPFTITCCCLKHRKESIHFNVLPPIT